MEAYPLKASVPSTQQARSSIVGLKHTAYLIEVDDCGKKYKRHRRYTNFLWLHTELRRRELACALPELPPKKVFSRMEVEFVERRRRSLEEYVSALLRLPAVIQDDTIWAFLDADVATAVVPRFLCKPASFATGADILAKLERVASREANLFRFSSPAVLNHLVAFAQADCAEAPLVADDAMSLASSQLHSQELTRRLQGRLSFCAVLKHLVAHERARQGLVEAGMFGALLALLSRIIEDSVVAAGKRSFSSFHSCADVYRLAADAVTDCLQMLLEDSRGTALLNFCEQDEGLGALRRLASAETVSLHAVAASLLWHGLKNSGVVDALVGVAARGLTILGKLLLSQDLRARLLAALCIGCVLRQETVLNAEQREYCFEALVQIPAELDAAEHIAVERAAAATLEGCPVATVGAHAASVSPPVGSAASSVPSSSFGSADRGMSFLRMSSAAPTQTRQSALPEAGDAPRRDESFAALLRTLCSSKELPRIQTLLGFGSPGDAGTLHVDHVTALAIAVLDHFSCQCAHEPSLLEEVRGVVPQLQRLLEAEDEGWNLEAAGYGGVGDLAASGSASSTPMSSPRRRPSMRGGVPEELRARAARVLIRLDWTPGGEAPGGDPPNLTAFARRAKVLEVLCRHCDASQLRAMERLEAAGVHSRAQGEHVAQDGLADPPSMGKARLLEFGEHISHLSDQRVRLGLEVDSLQRVLEGCNMSLEQRRLRHVILAGEIGELCHQLDHQSLEENGNYMVQQEVRTAEELYRATVAYVEQLRIRAREAETLALEGAVRVRDAEGRAAALASSEAELADLCHSAPAQVERLQLRLVESQQHRMALSERCQRLAAETSRAERRMAALREQCREAEVALENLAIVNTELDAFHATLNSELVLSDVELARLRQLDHQLQPARPSRLTRLGPDDTNSDAKAPPSNEEARCHEGVFETGKLDREPPPIWDDGGAEQKFRAKSDFRSFSKLLEERKRLWLAEEKWLTVSSERMEASRKALVQERQVQDQEEKAAMEQEEQLRHEIAALDDPVGHTRRHQHAVQATADARDVARNATREAAEAEGVRQLAETRLDQGLEEVRKAEADLTKVREAAAAEDARSLRARVDIEARTLELEAKMRHFVEERVSVEMEENRLSLRQARVGDCLNEEAAGRMRLREEVHRLIEELEDMDRQLDVAPRHG